MHHQPPPCFCSRLVPPPPDEHTPLLGHWARSYSRESLQPPGGWADEPGGEGWRPLRWFWIPRPPKPHAHSEAAVLGALSWASVWFRGHEKRLVSRRSPSVLVGQGLTPSSPPSPRKKNLFLVLVEQGEQLPTVHLTPNREAERLFQGHTAKAAPGILTTSHHILQRRAEGELPLRLWLEIVL